MSNTFGKKLQITLFGESHGKTIGAVLDGLLAGIKVDNNLIKKRLYFRSSDNDISTKRVEDDDFDIISGVYNGFTSGSPICILIKNTNVNRSDYDDIQNLIRPGHADYTAYCKYNGFNDKSGGGHFGGRLTAPIVAAMAIVETFLSEKNISVGSHIKSCMGISDRDFNDLNKDIAYLNETKFPILDETAGDKIKAVIKDAAKNGDSVGAIIETAAIGVPKCLGEPWFDTFDGELSKAIFSIPAVKGIEFGKGFSFAEMNGSSANDEFFIEDGEILTHTNNNAGINGGITNGMPIVFRTVFKPTPSIAKTQKTVDISAMSNSEIQISGRHDPCIAPRARAVLDAMTEFVIADFMLQTFGEKL